LGVHVRNYATLSELVLKYHSGIWMLKMGEKGTYKTKDRSSRNENSRFGTGYT
jgi:hypothetical protein